MAETDKVAKKYRDEVLAKDPKLMAKITDEIIPQLWDDVMSGRGRQRPISIGSNYHVSRSLRADRCLDTQYPGYKLNVNGNSKRAILLILDRAEDQTPQFALAALYEHPDQPKIWNRMFINKMGSKE